MNEEDEPLIEAVAAAMPAPNPDADNAAGAAAVSAVNSRSVAAMTPILVLNQARRGMELRRRAQKRRKSANIAHVPMNRGRL